KKPLLRSAYRNFHRQIRARLCSDPGRTVELGSGIGMIKETIPDCLTTDLFDNPMVDQTEDAYALSFSRQSVANLILFDVWHHLEYPASAMDEFARVLAPGGRLILFEPAALSLLGRLVYGCFHHEPIHPPGPVQWHLPEGRSPQDLPYYAAQGNAWQFFRRGQIPGPLGRHWRINEVSFYPAFDWLAAGGFRARQLGPSGLRRPLEFLSASLVPFPAIFATRMLVVIEKVSTSGASNKFFHHQRFETCSRTPSRLVGSHFPGGSTKA
ncbi:MAG: methyltransferase domain-containing protein, partial [Opitutales bacterium]